ncbi:hypothetical protein FF38_11926 [Lucilia cuprina]|uniref:Uncharacterized protein n=1 Tax=Lucilia cuprina TaxID=7375 RepID=A0A0L0BYC5_LUCCU|nr:hypothetical protein FF38_11926 [Lucilia cuprina]
MLWVITKTRPYQYVVARFSETFQKQIYMKVNNKNLKAFARETIFNAQEKDRFEMFKNCKYDQHFVFLSHLTLGNNNNNNHTRYENDST